MTIRLSVIVPVYNVRDQVARCMASLLAQDIDPDDHEIIVIDDGTTDDSIEVVRSVVGDRANVVIATQSNQGLSAARNHGLRLARGRYVSFVDSDDHIAPMVLGSLVDTMERLDLQVLAFGHRNVEDVEPEPEQPRAHVANLPRVTTGMTYLVAHHYPNNAWWYMVERQHLEEHGITFEPGRFVEDAVFTARTFSSASRVAEVPTDVYRYVQRPGSIMRTHDRTHTAKLVRDYERVVFGLQELKDEWTARGLATDDWVRRIENRQQSFVFFLIGRIIRSDLPLKPGLPEALERLATIRMYPMSAFPGPDYPGPTYRALTAVFNRPALIYPFGSLLRAAQAANQSARAVIRGL